MLALLAAIPIAILPATSREVPADALAQAEVALRQAIPVSFEVAKLQLADEHLSAAGPACRADGACVCAAVPLAPGARALDLDVQRISARAWAVDVRLVAPCEDEIIDRRAAVVEAGVHELVRFAAEAATALLRGRDLPPLRYSTNAAAESAIAPAARVQAVVPEKVQPVPSAGKLVAEGPRPGAPEPEQAYLHALTLLQQNAYVPAQRELTEFLQRSPNHAGALCARGRASLALAQHSAALSDFTYAHELDRTLSMPVYGLAEALRQLGHREEAVRFYRLYGQMNAADGSPVLRTEAALWLRALEQPAR